jgi:branched-chain amino acid aminotransferase
MGTLPRNKTGVQQYYEAKLGFGDIFTEHMLTIKYSATDGGWETPQIVKTENLYLHPGAMVLHYGQQVFEGLKAFAGPKDEDILLFRPDMNTARFNKSCERMCIPTLDPKIFMAQMAELLRKDRDWIPRAAGTSLYIRPTVIAIDSHLGVRPSKTYLFYIIMSPVGAYYPEGFEPVKIMVTDKYVRAVIGGVGEAKTAANYAASLYAAEEAHRKGFTQVLWLNAVDKSSIEEVGTMNIFFRINDEIITPKLGGTILPGVTRDSVLRLCRDKGMKVSEKVISINDVVSAAQSGKLQEIFGSGTAAVVSPVSHFRYKDQDYMVADGKTGAVARDLFDEITSIQVAKKPDPYGWVCNVGLHP